MSASPEPAPPSWPARPWQRTAAAAGLLAGSRPAPTIFEEMTALAARHKAVNLGQGFPDTDGPEWIRNRAAEWIRSGSAGVNQYAPGVGVAELRTAIAEHQRRHYDLEVSPRDQVLVTTGATEGIAATVLALVEPGDEVVTFEPFFDSYAATIALAGAEQVVVPLDPPHFQPEAAALEAALTPRTRLVIVNTPHNPTGAVVPADVLTEIVATCARHDVLLLSDEVYEHLVYEGRHVPLATVPGAAGRTLSVSSAGKSFSLTGWKVGWVTGPAELVGAVRAVKQFLTYSSGPAYQRAVAEALHDGDAYLAAQRDRYRVARDTLVDGLRAVGLEPVVPASGYFAVVDLGGLAGADARTDAGTDTRTDTRTDTAAAGESAARVDAAVLAQAMAERAGFVGIPVGALCRPGRPGPLRSWLRLAFCKEMPVLHEAVRRLRALPEALTA